MRTRNIWSFKLAVCMAFLALLPTLTAQNMTVNSTTPKDQPMWLVQNVMVGPNMTVFSPIGPLGTPLSQPASVQLGKFNINNPSFGLDSGIVMVSTNAFDVVPGQSGTYTSYPTQTPSANLTTVLSAIGSSSSTQYDRAGIQFSFVAPGDSVKFDYVFASKEYSSYTCSSFNDVFGFFLIGQGINGAPMWNSNGTPNIDTVNLAVIPGTTTPVAVNTINQGFPSGSWPASNCLSANPNYVSNAVYYNANSGGTSIINMEGFTDVFTARTSVSCGALYTIKMFICDVSDGSLNSAVFIGARSFELPTISLSQAWNQGNSFNDSTIVEGCSPSWLYLERQGAVFDTMVVDFNILGTATSGLDYSPFPASITLLPGVTRDSIQIWAYDDGLAEPQETIEVVMQPVSTNCAVYPAQYKTFLIRDKVEVTVNASVAQGNDTLQCPGQQSTLLGAFTAGEGNTTGWWGTDTTGGVQLTVNPLNTETYYFYGIDECMDSAAVDSVTVFVMPYDSVMTYSDTTWICPGESLEIEAVARYGTPPYTITWTGGPADSLWTVTPSSSRWYTYKVVDQCGFITRDSVWVGVAPTPAAAFTYLPNPSNPLNVQFNNQSSDTNYVAWYFGDGDQSADVNPVHSYSKPGTYYVSLAVADSLGCADSVTVPIELRMDYYVYIPTAFTPNGDIINDRIKVEALGIQGMHWDIFNRWGLKVYSSDDLAESWDGTYGGQP
ncbi:MAG: choice-of-anchor L domain-containing protein, partial [Schleiferiaceae bacterium]|nr:choice-of-anchor L domain-containing protein [Schleiferiaceae bacterium]